MFDEILQAVKAQLGNHPDMSSLSPEQADAVHNEIANHVTNAVGAQDSGDGGGGGLLSSLTSMFTSGSPAAGAIEGGLVSSLASKFGLPPSVTGAISGALPGLLQKLGGNKS
ncbi:MAG: hypothetical protein LBE82_11665 [Chitinophagaceae bacterium]|jgi:hypothetical protein|nr:hypothetical protein [Chitinophagaceae bacterium]